MADRKKALFWLRTELEDGDCLVELPYSIAESIYNMLKEQPEIVRCQDCKFWHDSIRCQMYSEGMSTDGNWFCADGERR